MKLENGYKLIYEVVEDGIRSFKASQTGIPAKTDFVLMTCEIGANKLIYENNGKFYGTGEKLVPTYNDDGTSADTQLITDEAFAEVFVAKEPAEEEAGNEPDALNNNGTDDNGEVVVGDEE